MDTNFLNGYFEAIKKIEDYKTKVLTEAAETIQKAHKEPFHSGNMVYYVCEDENKNIVPAYCYSGLYKEPKDLKPIYDRYETCEYGWYDFSEVARILDVIMKKC